MITGREQEFRRLYEQEADARLGSLAQLALELEARGPEPDIVVAMFRHAHTLKGGAAVVGLADVSAVLHDLEALFDALRGDAREVGEGLVDGILGVVDGVRAMIAGAMAGADTTGAARNARAALARARAEPAPAPPSTRSPPPERALLPVRRSPALPPARMPVATPDGGEDRVAVPVPVARLDELVRLVGAAASARLRLGREVAERLGTDEPDLEELRELGRLLAELQEKAMRARMVTLGSLAEPLRRAVRDLARARGRTVRWELAGADTPFDRQMLERLREPLVALLRNAVDHGIESPDERKAAGKPAAGLVRLHARQVGAEIVISVLDDGRGVDLGLVREAAGRPDLDDAGALEAMFAPGVSTARTVTPVSGRGIGLDAVRAAVEALHGSVEVDSAPGRGTDLRLRVPLTLAVLPCLILETAGRPYALPLNAVAHVLPAGAAGVVDDMPATWLDGEPLPLADLARVLGAGAGPPAAGPVVVVRSPEGRHAFRVDALTGHRDVAVKDLGGVLPRLELLAGAAVEPDAGILLVLDPSGLVAAAARVDAETDAVPAVLPAFDAPPPARVLVVEDAPIIRELERSILSRAGYEVETACDGEEALERLGDHVPDLVLSDVDMPRMDGFALTEAIRAHPELNGVPVLLLTSRTDAEGRARGEDAGCDGYLVKERFDEHALVDAVAQLLGGRP